jgi:hypothetical protein
VAENCCGAVFTGGVAVLEIKSPAGLVLGGAFADVGSAVRWCGWGWCFDTVALF